MMYIILGLISLFPYLIGFLLFLALCEIIPPLRLEIRARMILSIVLSFVLNFTAECFIGITPLEYGCAVLAVLFRLLPFVLAIAFITLLINLKAILGTDEKNAVKPRRIVLTVLIVTLLVSACSYAYSSYPFINIPDEYASYIGDEELHGIRSALCNKETFGITLCIDIIYADEDSYDAVAVYFPFGGKLGVTRHLREGVWYGEYYDP